MWRTSVWVARRSLTVPIPLGVNPVPLVVSSVSEDGLSASALVALVAEMFGGSGVLDGAACENEAIAQRMFWRYPDGTLVTFAPQEGVFVSHETAELSADAEVAAELSILVSPVEWVAAANGFRVGGPAAETLDPAGLVALVAALEPGHGAPRAGLPWRGVLAPAQDVAAVSAGAPALVEVLGYDGPPVTRWPWQAQLVDPDAGLPFFSARNRLVRLRAAMTAVHGWGQSTSGADLVLYDSDADTCWGASGWVSHLVFLDDPQAAAALTAECAGHGLALDPDGEETGFYLLH